MAEYNEAIRRPFSDWLKFGIGALMYMIPMVNIVTHFFGTGYVLKCAKMATRKNYKLPEWENWGQLFVNGLLALIIGAIYMLPAIVIGSIIGGATFTQFMTTGLDFNTVIASFQGGMLIVGLLCLLALYILPAGFVMFATRDNFAAAFDFSTIFSKAFTGKYLLDWIIAIAYGIIVTLVAGLLSAILSVTVVLPFVVAGCAAFMTSITAATIFGETWSEIKVK